MYKLTERSTQQMTPLRILFCHVLDLPPIKSKYHYVSSLQLTTLSFHVTLFVRRNNIPNRAYLTSIPG